MEVRRSAFGPVAAVEFGRSAVQSDAAFPSLVGTVSCAPETDSSLLAFDIVRLRISAMLGRHCPCPPPARRREGQNTRLADQDMARSTKNSTARRARRPLQRAVESFLFMRVIFYEKDTSYSAAHALQRHGRRGFVAKTGEYMFAATRRHVGHKRCRRLMLRIPNCNRIHFIQSGVPAPGRRRSPDRGRRRSRRPHMGHLPVKGAAIRPSRKLRFPAPKRHPGMSPLRPGRSSQDNLTFGRRAGQPDHNPAYGGRAQEGGTSLG